MDSYTKQLKSALQSAQARLMRIAAADLHHSQFAALAQQEARVGAEKIDELLQRSGPNENCPHDNIQSFTDVCLDCGENINRT